MGSNGREGDFQCGDTWQKRILWGQTRLLAEVKAAGLGGNLALVQSPIQGYKLIQRQNCGLGQGRDGLVM